MASSRVGSRIRARIGPRLPRVLGTEFASIRSIIGIRKLRVLPVPVEAVARISAPSRAGGIALAWTGVGVINPALLRRFFSESEILKSLNRTSLRTGARVEFAVALLSVWGVSTCGSRVAVVKYGPLGSWRDSTNECRGAEAPWILISALLSVIEALLLRGETCPLTGLPARATSAASNFFEGR